LPDAETFHALRPILRNWVWEHGRVGTRFLDCPSGEIRFDEGKKSHFLAEGDIYVPLGREPDAARTSPAVHEGGLARLLRAAQLGHPAEAGSPAEVLRAVQDCVDLAIVSAYQRDARAALARYQAEPMFDDEIRAALVQDVRAKWCAVREKLELYDFTIFHGLPQPLMIGDAAFVDWRVRAKPALPLVTLPLGPYCILAGTPSTRTSRSAPPVWKEAPSMGPFKDHNRHQVEGASRWLVATSDEQLEAVQARFAPPEEAPSGKAG